MVTHREFACHLVNDQLDSSSDLMSGGLDHTIAHSLATEKKHDVAQAIT